MNISKIFLASLLLLAIITMGAVSAEDSAALDNDTLSLDEFTDVQTSGDNASVEEEKTDLSVSYDAKILDDSSNTVINLDNFKNQNDQYYVINGKDFNLSIDGNKEYFSYIGGKIEFNPSWLRVGNHTFQLNFTGNEKYNPFVFNGSFEICKYELFVSDNIVYGTDHTTISVILPKHSYGETVYLDINGKTYKEKIIDNNEWDILVDLDEKENPYVSFDLDALNVACGNHTLVLRTNNEIICRKNITIDYVLSEDNTYGKINYGFDDSFEVYLLPDMDPNKISVKIDGIKYNTFTRAANFEVNCTGIAPGNHTVSITYRGDKKYNRKTFEYVKEVQCTLQAYTNKEGYSDGMYLYMPEDAEGRLYIAVQRSNDSSYREFANVSAAGKVYIPFDNISYGHYSFIYNYTADDYKVYRVNSELIVNPELKLPSGKFMLGDEISVFINSPAKKGILSMEYWEDGPSIQKWFKNGNATVSLICIKEGHVKYTVYLDIYPNATEDSYGDVESYWWNFKVDVVNPITAKDTTILYSANGNYKVQIKDINGKTVKSGKVTFYIMDGSKTIKKQTVNIKNGAATLSYKITQAVKKYTMKIKYNDTIVSKKITVKHVVTLKSITVKKSSKKLVLQATLKKVNGKYLKSKKVVFKFNGKTLKTKTNSKGVAKVTIKSSVLKKLKVAKNVTYQATYSKDTVKKTVTVKK